MKPVPSTPTRGARNGPPMDSPDIANLIFRLRNSNRTQEEGEASGLGGRGGADASERSFGDVGAGYQFSTPALKSDEKAKAGPRLHQTACTAAAPVLKAAGSPAIVGEGKAELHGDLSSSSLMPPPPPARSCASRSPGLMSPSHAAMAIGSSGIAGSSSRGTDRYVQLVQQLHSGQTGSEPSDLGSPVPSTPVRAGNPAPPWAVRLPSTGRVPKMGAGVAAPRAAGEEQHGPAGRALPHPPGDFAMRFGDKIVLRSMHGQCVRVTGVAGAASADQGASAVLNRFTPRPDGAVAALGPQMRSTAGLDRSAAAGEAAPQFRATADGTGTGAAEEALVLVNPESRMDSAPLRYGALVSFRCRAARERFLSYDGSVLSFRGTITSNSDKWQVLRQGHAANALRGLRAGLSNSGAWAVTGRMASAAALAVDAEHGQPHEYVRPGDVIVLRHFSGQAYLALSSTSGDQNLGTFGGSATPGGSAASTAARDGVATLGVISADAADDDACAWQISRAGMPFLPIWTRSRPYLTGDFLLNSARSGAAFRASAVGWEGGSSAAAPAGDGTAGASSGTKSMAPLTPLPGPEQQEVLLLEDLLAALVGLEGSCVRTRRGSEPAGAAAAAAATTHAAAPGTSDRDSSGSGGVGGTNLMGASSLTVLSAARASTAPTAAKAIDRGGGGSSGSSSSSSAARSVPTSWMPFGALTNAEFWVVEGLDEQLAYLAERVLPLCDDYIRVSRFVADGARYERGLVMHALAAAVRLLLREYLMLVAQLESAARQGRLSLQRLWYALQPSLRSMRALRGLAEQAAGRRGGALLECLGDAARSAGDSELRQLYGFLLERTSVPYFRMLTLWVYHGELDDPYDEFMVFEDESVTKEQVEQDFNSQYWQKKYTIREHDVYSCFRAQKDKILTTGKYLNVVRECGRQVLCPFAAPILPPGAASSMKATAAMAAPAELTFTETIERAHAYASRTLLELVMTEEQLPARLRSIKHYFLMDRGDFFVHFMDSAAQELRREVTAATAARIDSLLHLSVQVSSAAGDAFREDLRCEFSKHDLISHLDSIHEGRSERHERHAGGGNGGRRSRGDSTTTYGDGAWSDTASETASGVSSVVAPPSMASGMPPLGAAAIAKQPLRGIDSLMVAYKVHWPVSLIVSKRALTKYQMLFRHLFFTKHVERALSGTWLNQQAFKELTLRGCATSAYRLRQRMLHFMQNLVYYMHFEVVEPRWHELEAQLREASTMDAVIGHHGNFQDTCLKECLLTNQDLLKILSKLMMVCLQFADCLDKIDARGPEPLRPVPARAAAAGGRAGLGGAAAMLKRRQRIEMQSQLVRDELMQESYRSMLRDLDHEFDRLLFQFMRRLWDGSTLQNHSHLSNLCTRLDYNHFLSRKYAPRQEVTNEY